jgi:hypothetical protein
MRQKEEKGAAHKVAAEQGDTLEDAWLAVGGKDMEKDEEGATTAIEVAATAMAVEAATGCVIRGRRGRSTMASMEAVDTEATGPEAGTEAIGLAAAAEAADGASSPPDVGSSKTSPF